MDCIEYSGGYKYQLKGEYLVQTPIKPDSDKELKFISLSSGGVLTIKSGYAWDGATGAPDTPSIMRGALVHDALYQLMREGCLNNKEHKKAADQLLREHCREDGMNRVSAWGVYRVVRLFGHPSTTSTRSRQRRHAPKGCPKEAS